jgi:hypothetical protein
MFSTTDNKLTGRLVSEVGTPRINLPKIVLSLYLEGFGIRLVVRMHV